jgi:hypothetical protein
MWTRTLTLLVTLALLSAVPGCIPPLPEDDDTAGDDDTGDDDTGDDDTGDDDTGDDDTGDDDTGDDDTGDDDTGDDDTGDDDTGDDDTTALVDADGDGYPADVDCDDSYAYAYPGAPEICDGVADNNCDGLPDGDESDADGDFWSQCDGDCDDADPAVNPGAWEDCSDSTDNDCDGAVDCDDVLCTQAPECSGGGHDILVIYDTDPTMATSWADFLNLWGHDATIKPISELAQADLWLIDLFIVDGDAWFWDIADAQSLMGWGTPVIGVGDGIMALSYAGTTLGSAFPIGIDDYDGFTVDDPGHDVYNTPTPMGLAVNTPYPVIPYAEQAWALDLTVINPAQVECLAASYNYPGYSMVAQEQGQYAYWGWSAHDPWSWSGEGQVLLTNLIEYLVP